MYVRSKYLCNYILPLIKSSSGCECIVKRKFRTHSSCASTQSVVAVVVAVHQSSEKFFCSPVSSISKCEISLFQH